MSYVGACYVSHFTARGGQSKTNMTKLANTVCLSTKKAVLLAWAAFILIALKKHKFALWLSTLNIRAQDKALRSFMHSSLRRLAKVRNAWLLTVGITRLVSTSAVVIA